MDKERERERRNGERARWGKEGGEGGDLTGMRWSVLSNEISTYADMIDMPSPSPCVWQTLTKVSETQTIADPRRCKTRSCLGKATGSPPT
jgi:hypothetical protein